MNGFGFKVALVVIAVLVGIIAGLVGAVLSCVSGATVPMAAVRGGVAFGGTVTLVLLIENALWS